MAVEDPTEMESTDGEVQDSVNPSPTSWDGISNVSDTPLIEDIVDDCLDSEKSKTDGKCGHLTSHCCLSNGNAEKIGSSRSSTDSGVMMGNPIKREADKSFPDIEAVHDNSNNFLEIKSHDIPTTQRTELNELSENENKLMDILRVPEDFGASTSEINSCTKLEIAEDSTKKLVGCPVLKNIIDSRQPIDTVISCAGGKIGGHRVVLAAASPFLGELFKEHKLGEVAILILPDISVKIVEILLQLCYSGEMIFPKALESEVYEAMECLMIGTSARLSLREVTVKIQAPVAPTPQIPVVPTSVQNIPIVSAPLIPISLPSTSSSRPSKEEIESDDEVENETSDESPSCKQLPAAATLIQDSKYRCSKCPTVWGTKLAFVRHFEKTHQQKFHSINVPRCDLEVLLYCSMCHKRHESVNIAQKCEKLHKLSRCWTCLGMFSATDLLNHYREVHGIKTEDGLGVKCRWCDIIVRVPHNYGILKHSSTHISSSDGPQIANDKLSQPANNKKTGDVSSFLSRFTNNMATVRGKDCISKSNERKLGEDGKPLQVARRTGVPIGRGIKRKVLSPSMQFTPGTFTILPGTGSKKISLIQISKGPGVQVHLDVMSEVEIVKYLQKKTTNEELTRGANSVKTENEKIKPEKVVNDLGKLKSENSDLPDEEFKTKKSRMESVQPINLDAISEAVDVPESNQDDNTQVFDDNNGKHEDAYRNAEMDTQEIPIKNPIQDDSTQMETEEEDSDNL